MGRSQPSTFKTWVAAVIKVVGYRLKDGPRSTERSRAEDTDIDPHKEARPTFHKSAEAIRRRGSWLSYIVPFPVQALLDIERQRTDLAAVTLL